MLTKIYGVNWPNYKWTKPHRVNNLHDELLWGNLEFRNIYIFFHHFSTRNGMAVETFFMKVEDAFILSSNTTADDGLAMQGARASAAAMIYCNHKPSLTHCGLMTPYGDIDLGQHWLRTVMACCRTAPSHYLNQCWLIISKIQLHSSDGNFTRYHHISHQWLKLTWKLLI